MIIRFAGGIVVFPCDLYIRYITIVNCDDISQGFCITTERDIESGNDLTTVFVHSDLRMCNLMLDEIVKKYTAGTKTIDIYELRQEIIDRFERHQKEFSLEV